MLSHSSKPAQGFRNIGCSLCECCCFVRSLIGSRKPTHIPRPLSGIFAGSRRELSADGYEMTWAVNVLAPFLLGALLQDAVSGRIVNVSSISAARDLDWGNLNQARTLKHRQISRLVGVKLL